MDKRHLKERKRLAEWLRGTNTILEQMMKKPPRKYVNYMNVLRRGRIPKLCPPMPDLIDINSWHTLRELRDECIRMGLWVCIDQTWTGHLADWIGKRHVLEIMAGGGWLSKALRDHGVKIVATDQKERWSKKHTNVKHWKNLRVYKMDAKTAIARYKNADILLVSWPPYDEDDIVHAVNNWGKTRPIIYIGEGHGGCTACDRFHNHFHESKDAPIFFMEQWPGIHDRIMIGYWDGV